MTDSSVLIVDGSRGEGGGQIVRSSLALSAIIGQPIQIDNVRAGRRKPGLLRQHLTALRATAAIASAEISGDAVGSPTVRFAPGQIRGGEYHFQVGTAGSTMLVLQTILAPLLTAADPSSVVLEGGTHNPQAPPFDFIERAYLPLVRRMGGQVDVELERPGFYPAGGGRVRLQVQPGVLRPIELLERGEQQRVAARAVVSALADEIAKREVKALRKKLPWPTECFAVERVADPRGPGNIILAEVESEHVCEVFSSCGVHGLPSETVAATVARQVRRYLKHDAPVGPYLTDQLLLPMALAGGGCFRTMGLSRHATTHIELIEQLLGRSVTTSEVADGRGVLVRVG